MGRIVVGVDGSELSVRALEEAVVEARMRGADLELLHAIPEPYMVADPVLVPAPPREQLREEALAVIDQTLAEVDTDGLKITKTAEIGSAGHRLCEASEGAELLVVGSRGMGGFRSLLLGSVTQQVVAHSQCPILVVVPEGR